MSQPIRKETTQRPRAGFAMMLALRAVTLATNVASVSLMSRLLVPADFGLAAMTLTVVGLATVLRDLGLTSITVQKQSLTSADFGALFWGNVVSCLAFTVSLVAASGFVGTFYGQAELQMLIIVTTLGFLIAGLSAQHRALLQREMMFKGILVAEAAGLMSGIVAAVTVAISVGGPLSLAVASPIGAFVSSAIILWFAPRMSLPFPGIGILRQIMPSSFNLTVSNMAVFVSNNIGQVLVGLLLGPVLLGHYNRAQALSQMPAANLGGPLSQVMLPMLSRLHGDEESYRRSYKRYLLRQSTLLLPIAAILPFISESLVLVLIGDGWTTAAAVLAWFAPAIASQGMSGTSSIAMISQGRTTDLRNWGFADVFLRGSGSAAGLYVGGVEGAAAGFSLTGLLIGVPAVTWLIGRSGPVSWLDQCREFFPGLVLAATAVAGCLSVRLWSTYEPGLLDLLLISFAGLAPAAIVAAVLPSMRHDLNLAIGAILRLASMLSRLLRGSRRIARLQGNYE